MPRPSSLSRHPMATPRPRPAWGRERRMARHGAGFPPAAPRGGGPPPGGGAPPRGGGSVVWRAMGPASARRRRGGRSHRGGGVRTGGVHALIAGVRACVRACMPRRPARGRARVAPVCGHISHRAGPSGPRDEHRVARDELTIGLGRTRRRSCMAAAVRGRTAVPYALGTATSDGLSWDELVAVVHRQMRSLAGPSRELEDLTQVALEQVVRSAPRFRGDAELTTFTYTVCVHVVMNQWRWWRRWALRFQLGLAVTEPEDTRSGPAHLVIERERAERLYACLER